MNDGEALQGSHEKKPIIEKSAFEDDDDDENESGDHPAEPVPILPVAAQNNGQGSKKRTLSDVADELVQKGQGKE